MHSFLQTLHHTVFIVSGHFKQYKQAFKMKFTHPALLALLSTTTALPFFQGSHPSLKEGLLPRQEPLPTTPTNFPPFTMPSGTGSGGFPAFPTGIGMTPHHGGHGAASPSGSVKHHSAGPHPRPTKSKSRNVPRQFPTATPPSYGSWPTGVNSDNGAGFLGGGGSSPTGFPTNGKHPHHTAPYPSPYPTL
jgi:hypothetical protein